MVHDAREAVCIIIARVFAPRIESFLSMYVCGSVSLVLVFRRERAAIEGTTRLGRLRGLMYRDWVYVRGKGVSRGFVK